MTDHRTAPDGMAAATGSALLLRAPTLAPALPRRDPREDWPEAAGGCTRSWPPGTGRTTPLPLAASGCIAHQRSAHTQRGYARHFRLWESYAHQSGVHPLAATLPLGGAFAWHLATALTLVWPGGRREPAGPPRKDTAQAAVLASCSSFYDYAAKATMPLAAGNPFAAVNRPRIDPDYSPHPRPDRTSSGRCCCSPPATTTGPGRPRTAPTPCC